MKIISTKNNSKGYNDGGELCAETKLTLGIGLEVKTMRLDIDYDIKKAKK